MLHWKNNTRILAVKRVKNHALWKKFFYQRKFMENQVGVAQLGERMMWHGTNHDAVISIVQEGFDLRVCRRARAFGESVYFSDHSRYSQAYSSLGPSPITKTRCTRRRRAELSWIYWHEAPPSNRSWRQAQRSPQLLLR